MSEEKETALRADLARLKADFEVMANSIPQLAWMAEPDGWIFWYNKRWFEYTGTTLSEMQGWGWRKVHHQDHVQRVVDKFSAALKTGEPWEDLFPLRGRDGRYRWFLSRAMPVRDASGAILRWFGTNTDVTEQKETEERQRLLMREIDHRARNALAVAQAIVKLTRGDTIDAYKQAAEGRIAAMARVHSLLADNRWEGADVSRIVREEMHPYGEDSGETVAVSGPALTLDAATAQSLSLMLHELATNAAKHGALSASGGRVSISWRAEDGILVFDWRESGGPPPAPPVEFGFGASLFDGLISAIRGASVERDWRKEGLFCRVRLPLERQLPTLIKPAHAKEAAPADAPPRILVVEDEALAAMDLAEFLRARRFEVIGPAGAPETARELLLQDWPDAAILDANLGGASSFDLAFELREEGVPVIFCTGYESLSNLPEALKGAPLVRKPFVEKEMEEALYRIAPRPAG